MKKSEAMARLKDLGTAQNRKVYGRHGVTGPMFGVSYANLGKLKREIKVDHDLAIGLWESGNHDARILASMIIEPERLTASRVDSWLKSIDNHVIAAAYSDIVARAPIGVKRMETWTRAAAEWTSTIGWSVCARLVEAGALDDDECAQRLDTIEAEIHDAKNRTRYAMNFTLIAIGARGGVLEKPAMAAAKRIGKVDVDHGETGCKTPDAGPYIQKTLAHRRKKATKKKATRKAASR